MSKNKILYDYLYNKNILNKENNYNLVYAHIEKSINVKRKAFNILALSITIIIVAMTSTTIYAKKKWDEEYKEYQNRTIKYSNAFLEENTDDVYNDNLNMDYVYQDGLGIKLKSLLVTDDRFQLDINFRITNDEKKDFKTFEFGYVIFDENYNIYDIHERSKYSNNKYSNYAKKICRELGLKYNDYISSENHIPSGSNISTAFLEEGITTIRLDIYSRRGFPKSKKLYIRIFDIGYSLANYRKELNGKLDVIDSEDILLYDEEWQFEIEIPEKFFDRDSVELELAEKIDGIEIEKATLSNTGLIIHINTNNASFDMTNSIIFVSDDVDNIYIGSSKVDKDRIELLVNVTKSDFDKRLYLNVNIPRQNINKRIELLSKE